MFDPFLGEIRMFAGDFAPLGWALCDGSALSISGYGDLFQLLGTTYGGDGQTTFNLPDLRGRAPVHMGQGPGLGNYELAQKSGVETVTLTDANTPAHTHQAYGSSGPWFAVSPVGNVWADSNYIQQFAPGTAANNSMGAALPPYPGGGQPHDNMLPFRVVNFIIAVQGNDPRS